MKRVLARGLLLVSTLVTIVMPATADAQATPLDSRFATLDRGRVAADPLGRPVTLKAADIRLGDALSEISVQADLGLVYSNDLVPVDHRMSVDFDATPAGVALRWVLADTDVDFELTSGRQVILIKRSERETTEEKARAGAVRGRITDDRTGEGISTANVWLEGTRWRTVTNSEGYYLLPGVEAGRYTITAGRIGYSEASETITVTDDETVVVDLAIRSTPTQLDAIVATVTGAQRVREMGHVVGRIEADSLVRVAPISTVSELLTGRVPGLQVFQTSGTVGGEVAMRVRSATSLELSPEPIVIVDGIRYSSGSVYGTTATHGSSAASPFNVEPTSRLNDLNPNDIESIEVVKGPSAATLYGTDAVNGVIVITTKRGTPGKARWNAYARAGISEIANYRHPDGYWGWSSSGRSCTLRNQQRGTCTQDSVTVVPNPINDSELTIFGAKPRWQYGANVSGGREDLRYYFSADFEDATGPIRLPEVMVEELEGRLGGGKPLRSQLEPNHMEKVNLRGNVVVDLGETAEARVSVGYTQSGTRQMSLVNPFNSILGSLSPDMDGYNDPIDAFARSSTEWVNRFSGSGSLEWRPTKWLSTRATLGLDLPNSHRYSLAQRDAWEGYTGTVEEDRNRSVITTGDLGATVSLDRGRMSSRTSVGAQYVRNYSDRLATRGTDLRPGGTSVIDAASVTANHYYNETVTLGTYIEQMVGFDDRLFVTGALRADGASTFGNDYKAAIYPKAGVSWVVSEEPMFPYLPWLDNLRLRYAFGASGQQPRPDMQRYSFSTGQAVIDGQTVNKTFISRLPSTNLRPERVREHEFGFDAAAFDGRVTLDMTWNRRAIIDQIRSVTLPGGFGEIWSNLGLATGKGFEAVAMAHIIDTPMLSLQVRGTHATNTTKVVDLGGIMPDYSIFGSMVEGYPLGARFMRPLLGYEDANGNGIIEEDEIVMGDTAVYIGRGTPGTLQTLTAIMGLFQHQVRVSAMLDRQSDYMQYNMIPIRMRNAGTMRAAVDPSAPLEDQAKVMATWAGNPPGQGGTAFTFVEPGDFIRLREVSVSLNLPDSWAHAANVRSAMVSVSGRNLGLWTRNYTGDPESARFRGHFGTYADNVPQARNWVVRVDLGF